MFYLLLFIAMCLAFRAGRVPMRVAAFAAVCLWGAYELFYGLLQIIGLEPSFNPAFVLTGHFENPGPFGGFIAINLAVMNLLPLPALDGGKIFFLVINAIGLALFKKQIPAKYENYIHFAGLVLLLALMAVITFSDVWKLIH